MLLTISTTTTPATDLGYLLFKRPAKLQTFPLAWGEAHVFYPEATAERCTAALMLDVDPVGLVRKDRRGRAASMTLEQYVNDRPYAATSFLSVAIAQVFGTALQGRCRDRPEAAATALPLEARVAAVPCRGGVELLRKLFEPLGYEVLADGGLLDERFPEWGESRFFDVTLRASVRLCDLLAHLYVLLPVLDNEKHYWVGRDEVAKLLAHGERWLAAHPERELIVARYLRHQRGLTAAALERLREEDSPVATDADATGDTAVDASGEDVAVLAGNAAEAAVEKPLSLHEQRHAAVMAALHEAGAKRVLDLGCGEGRLLKRLMDDRVFEEIVGVDASTRALEIAADRLKLDCDTPQRRRVRLLHGALTYRDRRLEGFDAAAVVEVIEHLDPPRLAALERVLFEFARPRVVVITTPNVEYNVKFEGMAPGSLRHPDHRFEWTRAEFATWANGVAERFGYRASFGSVGDEDPAVGAPTQMSVFEQV